MGVSQLLGTRTCPDCTPKSTPIGLIIDCSLKFFSHSVPSKIAFLASNQTQTGQGLYVVETIHYTVALSYNNYHYFQ